MHTTWKEDQKTSEILGFGRLSENPSDSAGGLGSGILREEAASEGLKITIIAEPGQWHVRLESHEQGSSGDGWGHDFTSAWEDIVDPRLRAKAKERD